MCQPQILIIDDDEDDRLLIQQGFEENNFNNLILFEDGHEALNYLSFEARQLPALIVSDLNMPKITGLELLSILKQTERLKSIDVVILSTADVKTEIESCKKLGAIDYIIKPSTTTDIANIAKRLTDYVHRVAI
jgi:CheY-like chemotaxis protein